MHAEGGDALTERVFVSHASADREFATAFVETILEGGCELSAEDYFYSSLADTGVPAGSTLLEMVRDEVRGAGLVIALVTPTYQIRPVCVAELGAAWALVDNLFPLLAPQMNHSDVEGVLGDKLVASVCDEEQLDALLERVIDATGHRPSTGRWTRYKQKWLAECNRRAESLARPGIVSAEEAEGLRAQVGDLREALQDAEAEIGDLREKVDALKEAKTAGEVAEALVPRDEAGRIAHYRNALTDALIGLPDVVIEAIYLEGRGESLFRPDPFRDSYGVGDDIDDAEREGYLSRYSDDPEYVLDRDSTAVETARDAYEALNASLEQASKEYTQWFKSQYGHPPELARRAVWDDFVRGAGPAQP